jgi:hypothetical protein
MLRIAFATKAIAIAVLFSSCAAGASELPQVTAQLLELPSADTAPDGPRLPAVPALPFAAARPAPIESEARPAELDLPAKHLREIQLPPFSLPQFEVADGPQAARVEFDELDHIAALNVRTFGTRSSQRIEIASVETQSLEPNAAEAPADVVESPRGFDSFAAAMAAIAAPEPVPPADAAPLLLSMAAELAVTAERGRALAPRRRPQNPPVPAPTAKGGPELPVLFELRRSAP